MVPFFHTLFTPFSHDFHMHSPSSVVRGRAWSFWGGGGIMQRRGSSLFRSPEAGISLLFYSTYVIYVLKKEALVLLHEDFKPTKIV